MPTISSGLLLYATDSAEAVLVFLVHPGGPFWAKKDDGAWSIPKGEIEPGEDPLAAARREFAEETGLPVPSGDPVALPEIRQAGGKRVLAFALRLPDPAALDPAGLAPGAFEMEWPPRSGRRQSFPEIDRAGWFPLDHARQKILQGQLPLLEFLVGRRSPDGPQQADLFDS